MSKFRTALPLKIAPFSIDYESPLLCIGSCFAEHIGNLLFQNKFPVLLNPFGILYNPISIQHGLEMLLSTEKYAIENLFHHLEVWHSFAYHGAFSHPDKKIAFEQMNHSLNTARHFLPQTKRLILTFGTANVFVKKADKKVVANCHKIPNSEFEKRRLTVSEIVAAFLPTLLKLKKRCPQLEVIFTVSPVRHIRDGLIENQRSKATLLLAIEKLNKELTFTHYFPSYELVLDDLRDYRFFEQDMIHPNDAAIQYIWDFFQQTYFSEETMLLLKKIKKVIQASQHRPFHTVTNSHQQFVKKNLNYIATLEKEYPFLDFSKEQKVFQTQLH